MRILVLLLATLAFACYPAPPEGDVDEDGVLDHLDNCLYVANPEQRDCEGDGFGDACDGDLDQNGVIDANDGQLIRTAFRNQNSACADMNGDRTVGTDDVAIWRSLYGKTMGEDETTQSGRACADPLERHVCS